MPRLLLTGERHLHSVPTGYDTALAIRRYTAEIERYVAQYPELREEWEAYKAELAEEDEQRALSTASDPLPY